MVAYLPLPGGHIKLAERFVDPAFSFVMVSRDDMAYCGILLINRTQGWNYCAYPLRSGCKQCG